jgi:hypothetical protein
MTPDSGRWSWDGMKENVTDGQKACEHIGYKQGCWWVDESLVRGEFGEIIGKLVIKTLISTARVPDELILRRMSLVTDLTI